VEEEEISQTQSMDKRGLFVPKRWTKDHAMKVPMLKKLKAKDWRE
jgi:hypothetical protein